MRDETFKGYTIRVVRLSHHIYRPSQAIPERRASNGSAAGYEQSMAAAKRWIREDVGH
jgi:hypothetical protein